MILNLDQTSLKYAPCSRQTLAPKNSKHVAISGISNEKSNHRDIRHHSRWTLSTISTYLWGQNYEKFAKI